jgi:VWFA-related protein
MGWSRPGRLAAAIATAVLAVGAASSAQTPQQVPQFRAGVALTRVEVRVSDEAGLPVKDLTAADFAIREDGAPQELALFQAVPMDDAPDGPPRTFVFVLGSGQLDAPTRAIQALADFVRTRCRPADRVGVVAYMRAVEPTSNHGAVARFLDAFRKDHQVISGKIRRGDGPDRPVHPNAVAAIDALFRDEALQVRDLAGSRGAPRYFFFNDFKQVDLALAYLNPIEGEKHAVLVSERPLANASPTSYWINYWIRRAAGARTALSFLNAGGVRGTTSFSTRGIRMQPTLGFDPGLIDVQQWVAEQTGGTATFFEYADKPLAALDRTTRFHYVLGYYPTREVTPDQYRVIDIVVRRPGVTPQYRHGYQAQPQPDSPEDYRRAITEARFAQRAHWLIEPPQSAYPGNLFVGISLKVPDAKAIVPERPLRVTVSIDPTWVYFKEDAGRFVADLELRLLADSEDRTPVGRHDQRVPIVLTAQERERLRSRWRPQSMTFDVDLAVSARPVWLRGLIYQFESDRTAAVQVRLPR